MSQEIITDDDEQMLDVAWFAIDSIGQVARFTSGGCGFLPESIRSSWSKLRYLQSFFLDCLPDSSGWIESGLIDLKAKKLGIYDKAAYVEVDAAVSRKGLYSFDCLAQNVRLAEYIMITRPSVPLNIASQPRFAREFASRTRYDGRFATATEIHLGDFAD